MVQSSSLMPVVTAPPAPLAPGRLLHLYHHISERRESEDSQVAIGPGWRVLRTEGKSQRLACDFLGWEQEPEPGKCPAHTLSSRPGVSPRCCPLHYRSHPGESSPFPTPGATQRWNTGLQSETLPGAVLWSPASNMSPVTHLLVFTPCVGPFHTLLCDQ